MLSQSHKYDHIINLPHHVSTKHKPMSLYDRAAQFSPFSALTGLDDEIAETARLTDCKQEITEDMAAVLNDRINLLKEKASERPEISVEYFVPDETKEGGAYITVHGNFKRIDEYSGDIILVDGTVIPSENVYEVDGEIFESQEEEI